MNKDLQKLAPRKSEKKCNFVFDVVVSQFDAPKINLQDPAKLQIDINFNNATTHITSSRINVTDFKTGSSEEFIVQPTKLRKSLENCGISVVVSYDNTLFGSGNIPLMSDVTERIEEGMSDLTHTGQCNFHRNGEFVGTLKVLFRLHIKCDEKGQSKDCRNVQDIDKAIAPHDILFLMSESQRTRKSCDNCQDILELEEGDNRLTLDLQRYQRAAVGNKADALFHCPVSNEIVLQLKHLSRDCEQVVDSILSQSGKPQSKSACQHLNKPAITSFSYVSAAGDNLHSPEPIVGTIKDVKNLQIKPIRFCPICLTNMSWLPKLAACPKCGIKPVPTANERNQEKKLTSDQILLEYLGEPKYNLEPCTKAVEEQQCRCSCKHGTVCAHCRIRKLCADIFLSDEKAPVCPKVEPTASEDFCIIEQNLRECDPYLAHVFSELRILYNIRDKKASEAEGTCDRKSPRKTKLATLTDAKLLVKEQGRANNQTENTGKSSNKHHKNCVIKKGAVPRHHGWDWSINPQARKYGWRPGFILKPIKKLMKFFLQDHEQSKMAKVESSEPDQLATLNVCKKNGEIIITLRDRVNSNVEMKPIKFTVQKSEQARALTEIKRNLKGKGFRKCVCHKPIMLCVCRNNVEKRHLERALCKECRKRGIESCVDELVLTDTSESEMEFEFNVTPPGAVEQQSPKKPGKLNNGTQTSNADKKVLFKYPIQHSEYWRPYNCAIGDRYKGFPTGEARKQKKDKVGKKSGGPHITISSSGGDNKNKKEVHPIEGKRGKVDMMKYLKKCAMLDKKKALVGPDGLTDAQRRRRDLLRVPMPPLETIPRRGRGFYPCADQCCYQYASQYCNTSYKFC